MRFKKPIRIPVYIYTEQEIEAEKMGVGDVEEMGFSKMEDRYFWSIDVAYADENKNRTVFWVAGNSLITSCPIDVFLELIENHNK